LVFQYIYFAFAFIFALTVFQNVTADVIKAIAQYGFETSPYPVVLSIENHCSLDQQKTLARIMVETFKEKLAMPIKSADGKVPVLPSPIELKYKILIKGKRVADATADEEEEEDDEDDEGGTTPKVRTEEEKAAAAAKKKKKSVSKTHPDLSNITYLGTGKVKAFTAEVSNAIPADMMASYSEPKTLKTMKNPDKVEGWIEHNKTHLR
jgi:phosphatidylinositol phospholipase C, delta